MEQIKKMKLKIFKKSSTSSKSRRDPKLRYSRSMPLRSSNDTDESYARPRPMHRGGFPLNRTDIHHVFDISPQALAIYGDDESGWPEYNRDNNDDCNNAEGPFAPRPVIDKRIVDQFPAPPTHGQVSTLDLGVGRPARPSTRPPTLHLDEFDYERDVLPDSNPQVRARMDTIFNATQTELRAARTHVTHAKQDSALQRSASSISGSVRTQANHPSLDVALEQAYRLEEGIVLRPAQPMHRGGGLYGNHAASQSTHSLGPNAHYRTALTSNHSTSNSLPTMSSNGIYNNPVASYSTNSLGTNARYRAALANTQARAAAARADPSAPLEDGPASVRRRNASSASSRIALSARRNGCHGPPPPESQSQAPYHPDVMRIARGPHGAKLQNTAPLRPARFDLQLEVNDTDGKEWGAAAKGGKGHASTVAGQGRGGFGFRR